MSASTSRSRRTARVALAVASLSGVALAGAAPSGAATGGKHLETNPGIVSLMDSTGRHVCSAVLVAPGWALTYQDGLTCRGADSATGNSHDRVKIVERKYAQPAGGMEGNDPSLSGAMLLRLDGPVAGVKPAKLSAQAPKKGEKLSVVAFNGPEGINKTLSLGQSEIVVQGHNQWLSWYGKPKSMSLETGLDSGALLMRGDKVVAFSELVTNKSADAEDIANVIDWVKKTTNTK